MIKSITACYFGAFNLDGFEVEIENGPFKSKTFFVVKEGTEQWNTYCGSHHPAPYKSGGHAVETTDTAVGAFQELLGLDS